MGTSSTVRCQYDRAGAAKCDTTVLPMYPETWTTGDLSGRSNDPNHVQGSKVVRQDGAANGGAPKGVVIRTLRWDLWRSN
jgi:hypothetical protein